MPGGELSPHSMEGMGKGAGQGKGLLRAQGHSERGEGNHAEFPIEEWGIRATPQRGWGAGRTRLAPDGMRRLKKLPSPLVLPSPSGGSASHSQGLFLTSG